MRLCLQTLLVALAAVFVLEEHALAQLPAAGPTLQLTAPAPAAVAAADLETIRAEIARLRAELADIERHYGARLLVLEQQLAGATGGPAPAPPPPPVQGGAAGASSRVFNPDMSVNGNVVATGGKNPVGGEGPPFQLTEVEAAFQAVVDPYARADFFLSAGPEGLEIEEGFITFTSLPANLLLKAGKLRAQFGKMNTLHTHALPTADRPLVTEYLVGGAEGLSDSGLSLSRLIQNPYLFLEATGEVYAATSGVFSSSKRSRLTYVGRLRAYHDLTEDMNLDVGASLALGPAEGLFATGDAGVPADLNLHKRLVGVDVTFRYRPLRRAIYRRLNLRSELVWSRQDTPDAVAAAAFGFYGFGEYQFARRWYAGARVDGSARPLDPSATDRGGALFLTFWPTEFSQIRTEFRHLRFAEGATANEVLLQFNFSIGAHAAHAF